MEIPGQYPHGISGNGNQNGKDIELASGLQQTVSHHCTQICFVVQGASHMLIPLSLDY